MFSVVIHLHLLKENIHKLKITRKYQHSLGRSADATTPALAPPNVRASERPTHGSRNPAPLRNKPTFETHLKKKKTTKKHTHTK